MKRYLSSLVALGIGLSLQLAVTAHAQTFSTTIHVGDPYRGTITFRSAPDMVMIPNTNVYTVRGNAGYDLYRYDGQWYLVDQGNWYRASSWNGPFTYVAWNSIPYQISSVPTGYRRTWNDTDFDRDNDGRADTDYDRNNDGRVDADYDRNNDGRVDADWRTDRGDWRNRDNGTYTRRYVVRENRTFRPGMRYRGSYLRFSTMPRMSVIPGTRVFYVRDNTFDRDLYRYGGNWYYVENGVWYAADDWRGPFFTIRWRDVPASLQRIPMSYRRNWTYTGAPDYRDHVTDVRVVRYGERTDFVLDSAPNMSIIPGSNVYFMRDQADYDLYRYGNSYYLVDDGYWYRAPSWRGPFIRIRATAVPSAVFSIPAGYRKTWVPTD